MLEPRGLQQTLAEQSKTDPPNNPFPLWMAHRARPLNNPTEKAWNNPFPMGKAPRNKHHRTIQEQSMEQSVFSGECVPMKTLLENTSTK